MFGALPLGFKVDDATFALAKLALEGAFSAGGLSVELTRRGDYVLIHTAGTGLAPLDHSQTTEDTILLGLRQANGTPAASFVSPVDDAIRAELTSALSDAPALAAAIGQADYIGGYIVAGGRPEVHVYVRYGGEEKANSVKALYDQYWQQQISTADTNDKAEAEGKTLFVTESYITNGDMMRRLAAATGVTVFGGILKLDLDTVALRQITNTLVDRFFRAPPANDSGGPANDSGAPAVDSGASSQP